MYICHASSKCKAFKVLCSLYAGLGYSVVWSPHTCSHWKYAGLYVAFDFIHDMLHQYNIYIFQYIK